MVHELLYIGNILFGSVFYYFKNKYSMTKKTFQPYIYIYLSISFNSKFIYIFVYIKIYFYNPGKSFFLFLCPNIEI